MPNAKKRTLYLLLSEFIQIRSPCHSPFCVFKSQETQPRAGHTREQDTRARTGHTRELDTLFAPPSKPLHLALLPISKNLCERRVIVWAVAGMKDCESYDVKLVSPRGESLLVCFGNARGGIAKRATAEGLCERGRGRNREGIA